MSPVYEADDHVVIQQPIKSQRGFDSAETYNVPAVSSADSRADGVQSADDTSNAPALSAPSSGTSVPAPNSDVTSAAASIIGVTSAHESSVFVERIGESNDYRDDDGAKHSAQVGTVQLRFGFVQLVRYTSILMINAVYIDCHETINV